MFCRRFDVMGSVDTQYMDSKNSSRAKRDAIGVYQNSGLSQYVDNNSSSNPITSNASSSIRYSEGAHFPANWDPRYTLFQGVAAFPDHREDYRVNKDGPREPTVNLTSPRDFSANYKDAPTGFLINGTLPVENEVGVHSLTDVPVYALGPCAEIFGGMLWIRTLPTSRFGLSVDSIHRNLRLHRGLLPYEHLSRVGDTGQWNSSGK